VSRIRSAASAFMASSPQAGSEVMTKEAVVEESARNARSILRAHAGAQKYTKLPTPA